MRRISSRNCGQNGVKILIDHENKLARLHLMSRNIVLTLPNTLSHRQEGYTVAGIQVHEAFKNMISCEEMRDQYVRTLDEGLRFSLTVEKTRRYVNDISDDNLADFIDNFAKMVLIDYTKLDFPSLLVYLCQRRGTRKYIGDMFEVCQFVIHMSS